MLASTPGVPETWGVHTPGKELRSRPRAIPLMEELMEYDHLGLLDIYRAAGCFKNDLI